MTLGHMCLVGKLLILGAWLMIPTTFSWMRLHAIQSSSECVSRCGRPDQWMASELDWGLSDETECQLNFEVEQVPAV